MTCIAAIVDGNGIGHIASDSLGSNGHTKGVYKNSKIFRKGSLLIGYTSSYRMGQLLEHSLTLPPRKVDQSLEDYMYIDFVEAVRDVLKKNGYLKIDGNKESIGTFLIICEGRIFKMQDDLALLETCDKFDACGSGEDYAIAVLHTMHQHTTVKPRTMLTEAVNTAARYVSTVGGDVKYIRQEIVK